jgi:hypothetical protein
VSPKGNSIEQTVFKGAFMIPEAISEKRTVRSEKVFVSNGTATISCPNCGKTKRIAVDRYCRRNHTIKVRCTCETSFLAHLEFRKHYRKPTELKGIYRITSDGGGGGSASIRNVSRGGIGFTVSGMHSIQIGQKALIDFVLDNNKSSRFTKEVEIRSVSENFIGCQFISHQPFEKDLGFYLQP